MIVLSSQQTTSRLGAVFPDVPRSLIYAGDGLYSLLTSSDVSAIARLARKITAKYGKVWWYEKDFDCQDWAGVMLTAARIWHFKKRKKRQGEGVPVFRMIYTTLRGGRHEANIVLVQKGDAEKVLTFDLTPYRQATHRKCFRGWFDMTEAERDSVEIITK